MILTLAWSLACGVGTSPEALPPLEDVAAPAEPQLACVPQAERCDGLDNDCDGRVDEDFAGYPDNDGDGYGGGDMVIRCDGTTHASAEDCDDTRADTHPGGRDCAPDGIDQDCDGEVDEDGSIANVDWDGDGFAGTSQVWVCTEDRIELPSGDCDDSDGTVSPDSPEVCDGAVDHDCDGLVGCSDSDCAQHPPCLEARCSDGIDSDSDGLVDCEDADCHWVAGCIEASCNDGFDEEGDGLIDCEDDDCWGTEPCLELGEVHVLGGEMTVREAQYDVVFAGTTFSFSTSYGVAYRTATATNLDGVLRQYDTGAQAPVSVPLTISQVRWTGFRHCGSTDCPLPDLLFPYPATWSGVSLPVVHAAGPGSFQVEGEPWLWGRPLPSANRYELLPGRGAPVSYP